LLPVLRARQERKASHAVVPYLVSANKERHSSCVGITQPQQFTAHSFQLTEYIYCPSVLKIQALPLRLSTSRQPSFSHSSTQLEQTLWLWEGVRAPLHLFHHRTRCYASVSRGFESILFSFPLSSSLYGRFRTLELPEVLHIMLRLGVGPGLELSSKRPYSEGVLHIYLPKPHRIYGFVPCGRYMAGVHDKH